MSARTITLLLVFASQASAQLDLHGQDLTRTDFSTLNLVGANLEGANLSGVNLSHYDLTGANLKNANLTGAHLDAANLTLADLRGAILNGVDFRDAILDSAKLDELDFTPVMSHRGAKFRFASMHKVKGLNDLTRCDFSCADLTGVYFHPEARDWEVNTAVWTAAQYDSNTKWPAGIDPKAVGAMEVQAPVAVAPADHREGRFDQRQMQGENLEGADLRDASFRTTDLTRANLRGANLRGADLTQAILTGADLTGADLRDAKLSNTKLEGANLSQANLEGTNIKAGMIIDQSVLKGANLRNTRGLDRFTGSDFCEADLRGANLLKAANWGFVPARFQGAKYNADTRWPADFDPAAVGATRVDGAMPLEQIGEPIPGPKNPVDVGSGKDLHGRNFRTEAIGMHDVHAANLREADLFGADLSNRDLRFADLRKADLSSAILCGADLTGADLRGAKLKDAHLDGANFSHANLEGADFQLVFGMKAATLKCANLRGVVAWPSNPDDLDLREADLRGANMVGPAHDYWYGSRMRGAKYDDTTKWPKGLALEVLGVVKVGPDDVVAQGPGAPKKKVLPPARILAPDKPKGAPDEETVTKLCEQAYRSEWGKKFEALQKMSKVGMSFADCRYTYDYKSMTYEPVRAVRVPSTGEENRLVFGVHVVCDMTAERPDGSSSTSTIDSTVYFYQIDGEWKLTTHREGYD